MPVPGTATSSFGRRSIINGAAARAAYRHRLPGADRHARRRSQPRTDRACRRSVLSWQPIIIDHGLGVYSYLAHLSEFSVEEGAMVERGQRIALSGATGRVTGPHLHWTMRMGSARVDPLSLIALLK